MNDQKMTRVLIEAYESGARHMIVMFERNRSTPRFYHFFDRDLKEVGYTVHALVDVVGFRKIKKPYKWSASHLAIDCYSPFFAVKSCIYDNDLISEFAPS